MKFDADSIPAFNREIEAAVAGVLAKHGVTMTINGGKFERDGSAFTPRLTFSAETASGEPVGFAGKASLIGLNAAWGTTFTASGRTYRIVDINLRASRYPVSVKLVSNGKGFKFAVSDVNRYAA